MGNEFTKRRLGGRGREEGGERVGREREEGRRREATRGRSLVENR